MSYLSSLVAVCSSTFLFVITSPLQDQVFPLYIYPADFKLSLTSITLLSKYCRIGLLSDTQMCSAVFFSTAVTPIQAKLPVSVLKSECAKVHLCLLYIILLSPMYPIVCVIPDNMML